MDRLYDIIGNLTAVPGVSGYEHLAFERMTEYLSSLSLFDEIGTSPVGSIYAIMRCGKKGAPLLLLDAHLDTVGFVVTEICEGGFLRVAPLGGIAPKILPAAKVNVYGKKTISCIFGSKPPHLQEKGESEKKAEVSDMFIDTGYSADSLKEIVSVGTPAGFPPDTERLLGNMIVGSGFDDRLCGAAFLRALLMLDKNELNIDIAFQFSGLEETTGHKGATTTAFRLAPYKAVVSDVTQAFVPGAPKWREGVRAGGGAVICYSPKTSRRFTDKAVQTAEREGIKYQLSASPGRP